MKNAFAGLAERVPCFRVTGQLLGANDSSQYIGTVSYSSLISRRDETLAIEVSLREPLLMPTTEGSIRTLLLDPVSGCQMVSPAVVSCIARVEAIAEKYRAALTRRDVAIRDFYDVDYAARELSIRPEDTQLVGLVRRKLAVPGNDPINVGPDRLAQLRAQLDARLKPVLREPDADAFDLDRAFGIVREMAKRLPASS